MGTAGVGVPKVSVERWPLAGTPRNAGSSGKRIRGLRTVPYADPFLPKVVVTVAPAPTTFTHRFAGASISPSSVKYF